MLVRVLALFAIWLAAAFAWLILSGTLAFRTSGAEPTGVVEVGRLWGPEQAQPPPTFLTAGEDECDCLAVAPAATDVAVDLAMEQRMKGLLWYSTYRVGFLGSYRIAPTPKARLLHFSMPLPAEKAMYDGLRVTVGGKTVSSTVASNKLSADITVPPGHPADVSVAYRSQGLGRWSYQFGDATRVHDFTLTMRTNFRAIDFGPQSLAPTREQQEPNGWKLTWHYGDLVAGYDIAMVLPEHLQPGPLAQRITMWAPLSLLFYFFVMFIITTIRRIDLHPMNYFFLAASFFAFHLLFAYTVDRLDIAVAFALCAAVSLFLNVSYLRLVLGLRFAAVEAALAQFFYLILFSLALFNEGSSGLAITIGAILTLFVTMQATASINWSEIFARRPAAVRS